MITHMKIKNIITALFCVCTFQCVFSQNLNPVSYKDGTQKLNGLVTDNIGKKRPGVLILPAWMGIDEEAKAAAVALAEQGYIAFIADIYGEGNIPTTPAEASTSTGKYKNDYNAYQKRIALALDELKKVGADVDRLAIIGYCFGGTGALEAARANLPVKGVVSIHGGLRKAADRPNGKLTPSILIEHPADDASVTKEDIENITKEMNEANADWQMIYYAHSKHTFTNHESKDYNEIMAKRAWQHTLLFLEELLK